MKESRSLAHLLLNLNHDLVYLHLYAGLKNGLSSRIKSPAETGYQQKLLLVLLTNQLDVVFSAGLTAGLFLTASRIRYYQLELMMTNSYYQQEQMHAFDVQGTEIYTVCSSGIGSSTSDYGKLDINSRWDVLFGLVLRLNNRVRMGLEVEDLVNVITRDKVIRSEQ
ncbi:hypothetical protein Tco_0232351 [Tanacetum coccineum]